MKKTALLSLFTFVCIFHTMAQTSFELVPTGGYTFPDQVNFYNAYGRIESSLNWGGSLIFNASRHFGIEMMYNRIDASSGIYNYGSQSLLQKQDVSINYIMAGPVQNITFPESSLQLFFGGLLGAAIFSPNPVDNTNNTKFAWGVNMGTNVYVSPRLGIKLKAQLLSPVQGASGGYYFGNFGGAAATYGYTAIYQFGLNAGLIIGLGSEFSKPGTRVIHSSHHYYRSYPPPPSSYYYH